MTKKTVVYLCVSAGLAAYGWFVVTTPGVFAGYFFIAGLYFANAVDAQLDAILKKESEKEEVQ